MIYITSYFWRDDPSGEYEREFYSIEEIIDFYDNNFDMMEGFSVTDESGEEVYIPGIG